MKYVFIAAYFLIMLVIGLISMRKISSVNDFFLGGRKIGPWMSAFAYGTTYFSAVIFIGYAGRIGWGFGLSAIWIGIGNALLGSLAAWLVLAKKTREVTHRLNISTMPEFFEKRYGSKTLKILSALVIFIFLVPYSASVYQGLTYLFEVVFHVPFTYGILAMALLTAVYLTLGGYVATATNDFVQGIIMLMGTIIMAAFVLLNPHVGGLSSGLEKLAHIDSKLVAPVGPGGFSALMSLVILTSMGSWGLPQMIHKFYTIKDDEAVKRATIISTAFALIVAGSAYFIGAFGRLFLNNQIPINAATGKPDMDMIMPIVAMKAFPDWLLGLLAILILSASMSTLASLVLVSSSAISMDLLREIKPGIKNSTETLIMRLLCLIFIIASVVIATNRQTVILSLMSFSWGTVSGSFLAPYFYGLYWKRTTRSGAFAGFIAGFATSVILALVFKFNAGMAPQLGAISMAVSMIAVPAISLLTQDVPHTHKSFVKGAAEEI